MAFSSHPNLLKAGIETRENFNNSQSETVFVYLVKGTQFDKENMWHLNAFLDNYPIFMPNKRVRKTVWDFENDRETEVGIGKCRICMINFSLVP